MGATLGIKAERAAFATAEGAFLTILMKKIDIWNEADDVQKKLEVKLAREQANHQNNMACAAQEKVELEAKISTLQEENRRAVAEGSKFKDSFENGDKSVHDFVGKTREKARDAFAEGFCLAWKQVLDQNPEVNLSGLNGIVSLAVPRMILVGLPEASYFE